MASDSARREIGTAVLVLSNEMAADGSPTAESARRLARAVRELERHPDGMLVTSGWGYRNDTDATLADAMAMAAARNHGIPENRILRLHRSRDTVGDAVFFALAVKPRRLFVITSEYHRARTEQIFRFVLGDGISLEVVGVGEPGNEARQTAEANSLAAFRMTFEGIAPGDLPEIERRLMTAHPFYNGTTDVKALRRHD
jgi:uncharacterized SAM-binding protein YcdF (DUF218 family)